MSIVNPSRRFFITLFWVSAYAFRTSKLLPVFVPFLYIYVIYEMTFERSSRVASWSWGTSWSFDRHVVQNNPKLVKLYQAHIQYNWLNFDILLSIWAWIVFIGLVRRFIALSPSRIIINIKVYDNNLYLY